MQRDLHGVDSAVVVFSNSIKEHKLLWPKVILPAVAGLWKQKGGREPHDVGNGYIKGCIPMPTGDGGWAFNPGNAFYFLL
jgi:hypothetical protein